MSVLESNSVRPVTSQKFFTVVSYMFCPILIKGNNHHSKMGQRGQHSASCMLTKSYSKAVFTATMKSCLTLMVFVNLVCRVGAAFPCKPEQIHWNTTVGKRPKCFDCPDCPPETEPSVPCGTSVNDWPDIHCVSCKLGQTYSDKYDTSQCKACTICSNGKAVKNNCTLATNTKCDSKCGPEFYTVRLISGCLPCAQCCGDGKDEFAAECANSKNKCKVRSTPCIRVQTTPPKPTTRHYSTSEPTKRNYSTSNTSPTVQAAANERVDSGKQDGISIVVILLIVAAALCVVLSISTFVKRVMPVGDTLQTSREQNSNNEDSNISHAGTPPLIHSSARSSQDSVTPLLNRSEAPQPNGSASPQHLMSTPLLTNETVSSQPEPNRSTSPHSRDSLSPQSRECEPLQPNLSSSVSPQPSESVLSQPGETASTHPNQSATAAAQSNQCAQEQVKLNPGDVTLEELEEKHFPAFERMCKDLNSKRPGDWWDFERLASCYDRISLTDRNSLKNEFQNGRGIPSDVLMSHIKTKYPDHTVRHLVRNLQSIGRDDIAQRLIPYTERKPSSTRGY